MVVSLYKDSKKTSNLFTRTFSKDLNSDELIWHRDRKDRKVKVLSGEGWEFQLDNTLPIKLSPGDQIFIPRETYHRVKKGSTDLKILIKEL